jgi:hypothetical protein
MVQRRSKLAWACRQSRETLVDFAESKLFEKIRDGNERCILYTLSTLGKHRGYAVAKGTELNIGDTTNLVMSVTVQPVESGKFLDEIDEPSVLVDGKLIDNDPEKLN